MKKKKKFLIDRCADWRGNSTVVIILKMAFTSSWVGVAKLWVTEWRRDDWWKCSAYELAGLQICKWRVELRWNTIIFLMEDPFNFSKNLGNNVTLSQFQCKFHINERLLKHNNNEHTKFPQETSNSFTGLTEAPGETSALWRNYFIWKIWLRYP